MNITWFEFILFSLATFRLTRLIVYDSITSFIRHPFHEIVDTVLPDGTIESYLQIKGSGIRRWIGELLSCYWCTGIWCSFFLFVCFLFHPGLTEPLIIVLAIAGLAAIFETVTDRIING
ncbi:DUF1360 domain-containing protein [Fredinandcohnia quinoae]|uniref:DUF1360 domain-containing protein n=1 Tax=Fredinandcohnia quinoae TaxID=2918902 RepID=A0AAW5E1N7_9BACI|nr:DUF1360 domain-containing protein [Fredinandcohnia sp. SECRCQ15]MCH1626248.1 DUF1360 domain-containing protein [Fredinandcohnia sp. SECRCQ15]